MTEGRTGDLNIGSGFIIDAEGLIVTNYHVVATAQAVRVRLKDGRVFPVTGVVGFDAARDLCVLDIDATGLPVLALAEVSPVEVGQKVLTIGSSLRFEHSLSEGLIAGVRETGGIQWLQFSAPISPGNSGGPLVNMLGEVIGVVSFMMPSGQNVNFAVAISEVRLLLAPPAAKMSFTQFADTEAKLNALLSAAREMGLQGRHEATRGILQEALKIRPHSVPALELLGLAYQLSGQSEQAIAIYQQAIQLAPSVKLYIGLAETYENIGRHADAIEVFQQAIAWDPADPVPYYNLGRTSAVVNQCEAGVRYTQQAIQLHYEHLDQAYTNLGLCYRKLGDWQAALSAYQQGLNANPANDRLHYNLGSAYQQLGKHREAITHFERALQLNTRDAESNVGLATVYMQLKEYQTAVPYLEKALQLDPDSIEAHANLGSMELTIAQALVKETPTREEAHQYYSKAVREFQRAIELIFQQDKRKDLLLEIEPLYKQASEGSRSVSR